MGLIDRLRAMVAATPPGSTVNLPVDWLRVELECEGDAPRVGASLADLTVEQLAAELGRSPSTVRGWRLAGEFPNAYQLGREWRIPRSDVRAYLDRQKAPRMPQDERANEGAGKGSDDLSSWRRITKGAA